MTRAYFVTGTDTDVGKTWISLGLLAALQQRGYRTLAMKPVACGCTGSYNGYRNDDALRLQRQATVSIPYEAVNPYALPAPVAPHLAATIAGQQIDIEHIRLLYDKHRHLADYSIMEGVGGWLVPLNAHQSTADMVMSLQIPVILVVGIRLGCLNHALLTATTLQQQGIRLAAWIANCIDQECLEIENNIAALHERLHAPLLGIVPYLESFDARTIAGHLDISDLITE